MIVVLVPTDAAMTAMRLCPACGGVGKTTRHRDLPETIARKREYKRLQQLVRRGKIPKDDLRAWMDANPAKQGKRPGPKPCLSCAGTGRQRLDWIPALR